MTLELTPREQMLLIELLDSAQREKLHELHHADLGDFKQYLRDRVVLQHGLVPLQDALPVGGEVGEGRVLQEDLVHAIDVVPAPEREPVLERLLRRRGTTRRSGPRPFRLEKRSIQVAPTTARIPASAIRPVSEAVGRKSGTGARRLS